MGSDTLRKRILGLVDCTPMVGSYIVDFVCLKYRLIIEVDGSQHLDNRGYDNVRTQFLESCGYQVLRFWNNQILQDLEYVLEVIYITLIRLPAPSPNFPW